MIKSIVIHNIASRYETDWTITRTVDRTDLVHMNMISADADLTENEFFEIACDYLDNYDDDVAENGCDYAKISEVF